MGYRARDDGRDGPNCGCILAFVVVAPIAFMMFTGLAMSGGGCEGVSGECTPDNSSMIGLVIIMLLAGAGIAKGLNAAWRWAQDEVVVVRGGEDELEE